MKSLEESGDYKNVANAKKLIGYCQEFGTQYNPSSPNLGIIAITAVQDESLLVVKAAYLAESNLTNVTDARVLAFKGFGPLCTRIVNAAAGCDLPDKTVENIAAMVRKLRGAGKAGKEGDTTDEGNGNPGGEAGTPGDETGDKKKNSRSNSQQSFDGRIHNFDKLITYLGTIPGYMPNEQDLTLAALQAKLAILVAANNAVIPFIAPYDTAINKRKAVLYTTDTALVPTMKKCKRYIKSVFGASSPEYKKVAALHFRDLS